MNVPVSTSSFTEFERIFGGLWSESMMSFSVRDFFVNGGGQAMIVRLHNHAKPATFYLPTSKVNRVLRLQAKNAGSWGNNLRIVVDDGNDGSAFNLAVEEIDPVTHRVVNTERFTNVSVLRTHGRYLRHVLEKESTLVKTVGVPNVRPLVGSTAATSSSGSDGKPLVVKRLLTGLAALENCDLFNLLCIPPYTIDRKVDAEVIGAAAAYCEMRRAFYIIDPPSTWTSSEAAKAGITAGIGTRSPNAAIYFPHIKQANPLHHNAVETFGPCGAVAGVFARTDAGTGVWKAPSGLGASLHGIIGFDVELNDAENGEFNPLAVNCLRSFPSTGPVVWGARTLQGGNDTESIWKYVSVRRTALFIEESIFRGTKWAVFESNDESLWSNIRLTVGAFMQNLFQLGAIHGSTPKDAYFVRCDTTTTTQNDINRGIVNFVVGFAPLKPTEFLVLNFQQRTDQST